MVVDRRFGEDDPTMTAEERARERFVREKRSAMFDLEEDASFELTHGGKSLKLGGDDMMDDFNEDDLGSDGDSSEDDRKRQKRQSLDDELSASAGIQTQERPKTKKEVMNEIIAKSKLYKQGRQMEKDTNDQLKDEIYAEYPEVHSLMAKVVQGSRGAATSEDPTKLAKSKALDMELRELAMLPRVQVSTRTKTEDEIAEEQREKLKEVEENRQKRMRGEKESDSSEEDEGGEGKVGEDDAMATMFVEEDNFGLGKGIKTRPTATQLGLDDEDDFFIEDNLIASGSESDSEESDYESVNEGELDDEDGDPDGALTSDKINTAYETSQGGIPSSFSCPQSYEDLIQTISPYPREKLPAIIQQIRTQYDTGMDWRNKERLGNFARALVDFVAAPLDLASGTASAVLESVIRHIHSLAKKYPIEISQQCRVHLKNISESRPTSLLTGDLVLLTAVGTIFPTSDHFHQVVTPAMLCIGRYLGQKIPRNLADYATGTYLGILVMQYQQLSKRYMPELINFSVNTLSALATVPPTTVLGGVPIHTPPEDSRLSFAQKVDVRKLSFSDCAGGDLSKEALASCKVALISTNIRLLEAALDVWSGKPSFLESFETVSRVLKHLASGPCRSECPLALNDMIDKACSKADRTLKVAELSRRTLELHHHRPIAIKTYDPKWEDNFDPRKHYDPDKDRAEQAKLKAEIKREKKGALSELRKDARFLAREKLKIQKAKDEAYERKMKRTIAEIQTEGGREANEYEREAKARKRVRKRH